MKKRLSTTLTATMLVFLCAIFACVVAATWIIAAQPTSYQPEQKNYTVNYNFEYNAGKAGKAGNAHFDGLSDDADDRTTFLSEYKQEEAGKTISLTYNETPNPSSDGVHISDLLGFNFAGWDFTGWSYNDDKLTDVPTLFEGGTISLTIPKDSDLNLTYKLTAKWDAINYTVTFTSTEHSDLIKNLPASKTLTYEDGNDKFDLPGKDDIDDLSYLGYEFAGWKLTIGELSQNYRIDDTDSPYVFELAEDILIALDGKEEITLDAIWDKISYTVNYKDGTDEHPLVSQDDVIDGMPDPDTQEEYTVGQEVILPTLSRAGFDFLGWKLEDYTKYGSDYKEIYDPNSGDKFKMPAGDVTFTAQWKAIDYTVKFDNNGLGKKLEDKNITIEKDNNSVALEKLEEDGYTFMSWQLVEAEMDYIPDVNFTFVLDTTLIKYADKNNTFTLVAIWWTNRYTVSFVQGYDDTDKVDEWDEVTDLPTIDDIPDYEDGGYKAAGGYKIGDIVKLPRLEPTRIGFVFQGWKIDGDDTLYKHDAGDINNRSYTCGSSNIIFVAQWKAVEYTVKYDLDDGTFGNAIVPEITYKMGDSVTLTDEEPTKTGYTFTGWSLDDEKAVEEPITIRAIRTYAKGDDYSKTITFKALWDINTYKVTYDTNGGEGTYAIQGYDYGATVTVSENVPTRKGYTFKGWQATKTEGGEEINNKLYKPNDEFEMPAFDVTLLAQWDFITYKVEYNPTSGTIGEQGPSSLTIEDSSFTLPTITRDGYEFLGWKLSKTGLEDKYFGSGEQTTDLSDIIDYAVEKDGKWTITFTAEWSAKEFKVSYADSISGIEGDDVAGIPDGTTSHKTDSTFNLAVEPTRTGFTFNGWLCDADNKVYGAGEEFKMPARNVTFTAQWKAIKYTLTFDNTYNNKKLGQKQTDVYPLALNDTKTATLSILEEDGYTFDGWQLKGKDGETRDYLVKDGQIQSFELTIDIINGFVGADDTFTLYAIWKPIGYTVTFEDGITKVEDDDVVKEGTLPKNADITDYKDEYNIGDTITIPTKEPERIGFTFLGWKVKDGGDTIYKNGGANNTYTFSAGSVTFVAQWKAKPYDIKFVTAHNAENKPADAKLALAGDDYNKTITFYALTAAGYSFNGWEANVGQVETTTNVYTYTLTVATIKELEAATPTKAIVVTAQWGAKTYTVKFENGTADTGKSVTAKNLPDTKTLSFKEGGMTTFTVDTPIADGYTFAIWTSDIAGITFNGTFDLNTTGYTDLLDAHNGTVTFTATWTINEYDITYNLSAADASIVEQTYVQKFTIEDTNITWPTAQRTGYNFDGWYYDQSFAKKVGYTSKPIGEELYEALNGSTTVTLYAHWTNKTYAVEYAVDPAGAGELTGGATTISLDANSNKVTFGVTVGTGYNFNTPTWKVTIKGTDTVLGNVIASEANGKYSFTLTADLIKDHTIADNATIVITAEFAKNDYYIAYDKGEAKDDNTVANWPENDTTAYNIGKLVTVTDKIPTRDGYTFAGWEANITVSGVDLTKDFTLIAAIITALEEKNTDTITLKATWTKDSYNIKYDLDGEIKGLTTPYDIDTASVTLKTAEELAALGKTAPTGYRFDGWYLSNTFSDGPYASIENPYTKFGTGTTLYAKWTPIEYTVEFKSAEGNPSLPFGGSTTISLASGKVTITFNAPTLGGYTFRGWTVDPASAANYIVKNTDGATEWKFTLDTSFIGDIQNKTIIITAQWDTQYTVTFKGGAHAANSNWTKEITVSINAAGEYKFTLLSERELPEAAAGWKFNKWSYNGSLYAAGTEVTLNTSALEVVADWTALKYYVEFVITPADACTAIAKKEISLATAQSAKVDFDLTAKTGYTFSTVGASIGAVSGSNGKYSYTLTEAIIDAVLNEGDTITITATFTTNTYHVKFILDGGTIAGKTITNDTLTEDYQIGGSVTIYTPTKAGYIFGEWSVDVSVDGKDLTTDFILDAKIIEAIERAGKNTITFTASWTKESYNIKYDLDGEIKDLTTTYDIDTASVTLKTEKELAALGKTAPTGYRFDGWYLSNTFSDGPYASIENPYTKFGTGTTLYAKWTAIEYTINFLSGKSAGNKDVTWTSHPSDGLKVSLDGVKSFGTASATGYNFVGWKLSNIAAPTTTYTTLDESFITAAVSYMNGTTITLYAHWTAITYNVAFNNNGHGTLPTERPSKISLEQGITLPQISETGWKFNAWQYAGKNYNRGETFNLTSTMITGDNFSITFVADWQAIQYTITYNMNGHDEVQVANQTFTVESSDTTLSTPAAVIGYKFLGWKLKSTDTGYYTKFSTDLIEAANKSDTVATITITLTADWQGLLKVTFKNGDSEFTVKYVEAGKSLGADWPTGTPNAEIGYRFKGWCTNKDGEYNSSTEYTKDTVINAETILYAKFVAIEYTIAFTSTYNQPSQITGVTLKNAAQKTFSTLADVKGYTFGGWYYNISSDTAPYTVLNAALIEAAGLKDNKTDGQTITLTAKWSEITYTLNYVVKTGEGNGSYIQSMTYSASGNHTLYANAGNEFIRTGYTLTGWQVTNTSGSKTYTKGQSVSISDLADYATKLGNTYTITLTAQWTINQHTVKFVSGVTNDEGVSGMPSPAEVQYNYSEKVTIPANPTRTGYKFNGWSDGNGNTYFVGSTFNMPDKDVTLTAQWTEEKYYVYYESGNTNGGTVSDMPTSGVQHDFNSQVDIPSKAPTCIGWTFKGWKDQDGKSYSAGGQFSMPAKDVTLTAQWEATEYNIMYVIDHGTRPSGLPDKISLENPTFTVIAPTANRGYEFKWWTTNVDNAQYSGNPFTLNSDKIKQIGTDNTLTFTAQWITLIKVKDDTWDIDYNGKSLLTFDAFKEAVKNKVHFVDYAGNSVTLSASDFAIEMSMSNGSNSYSNNATNAVIGSTYSATITITLASTTKASNYKLDTFNNITKIIKYKTVDFGGNYYTIEDALKEAKSGTITVKANTSFTSQSISQQVYSTINHTVNSGVTLLLPYKDGDTKGFEPKQEWPYDSSVEHRTDFGDFPTSYKPQLYVTLTVPAEIVLSNSGTLTVGGLTGAAAADGNTGGHIGRISAGYSELKLYGTLKSNGTLNVYGNITGNGAINAMAGTVLERMEIVDWPGGNVAGARFVGPDEQISATPLLTGGTVTVSNPNEFPFEEYRLQAIQGPTLTIHSGAYYQGDVRIFTNQMEKLNIKVPSMLSVAQINIVGKVSGNTADGIFGLKSGATLKKQLVNGREVISISGGMVGGTATLDMDLINGKIKMDTSKVKFPISKQMDLIFDGGDSTSQYGYEFMSGATLKLTNKANLTLTNNNKGTIAYSGSRITVGEDCALYINGVFGGSIYGAQGAMLAFAPNINVSNSAYIGGNGSFSIVSYIPPKIGFTFTGTLTTVVSTGLLVNGQGNFVAGKNYKHNGSCWVSDQPLTATWNANGGVFSDNNSSKTETYNDIVGYSGDSTQIPWNRVPVPTQKWYSFTGWSTAITGGKTYFNQAIDAVFGETNTFYALWTLTQYKIKFVVEYPPNYSGAILPDYTWSFGNDVTLSDPTNVPEGLKFSGWFMSTKDYKSDIIEDNKINADLVSSGKLNITDDDEYGINKIITIYGRFTEASAVSVAFEIGHYQDEISNLPTDTVKIGETFSALQQATTALQALDDTKHEYYFTGWTANGKEFTSSTTIAEDHLTDGVLKLVAQYGRKTKVSISDTLEGSMEGWYKAGATIADIGFDPEKDDYNVNVSTYFNSWTASLGGNIPQKVNDKYTYTVPSGFDGQTINITSNRGNKVKLIIHMIGQNALTSRNRKTATCTVAYTSASNETFTIGGGSAWSTTVVNLDPVRWIKPNDQTYTINVTKGTASGGSLSGTPAPGASDIEITINGA